MKFRRAFFYYRNTTDNETEMTFVFLHGIEQQGKTADELRTLWIESIRVGLDRAKSKNLLPSQKQVVVPYYGDLLARLTPNEREKIKSPSNARGLTELDKENAPFGQHDSSTTLEHLLKEINRAKGGFRDQWPGETGPRTRGFTSNALGTLSKVLPVSAQNQVVNQVLRQVAGYLDDTSLKHAILDVASSAVRAAAKMADVDDEPLIVVAHSLGTVIALEVLADFTERSVDLLMTIGSPLSTETVASRMIQNARRWPQSVRKWVNVADPDDLVALHHSIDRRNFLKNCSDSDPSAIWNILDIKNHMNNHHGIVGYLDDPVVAQLLTDNKLWL
jgi:predicted alpha/beta hydrolase family esterase